MATNEDLRAIAVGDTVMVATGYRDGFRETKVNKIGRTLIHTEDGRSYTKEFFCPRDGYPGSLLTMAMYNDRVRRNEALDNLRDMGWDLRGNQDTKAWSTDQVVALANFARYVKTMNQQELASALANGEPIGY